MNSLRLFVNGFLIGIANIIPGMSGGTLALVLGIYERLIGALRRIGFSTVKKLLGVVRLKKHAFTEAGDELRRIDFGFLALLGIGAIAALLLTSKLIVYLLNNQHDATYGFFSGLILTSILIPARMLKGFGVKELIVLLIAVALILGLSLGMGEKQLERVAYKSGDAAAMESPAESATGFPTYWELGLFFGSGALAVSAMILPGISGSFLMLALGVYFPLLTAINTSNRGCAEITQRRFIRSDVRKFTDTRFRRDWMLVRASGIHTVTQLSTGTLPEPDDRLSHRFDGRFTLRVMALSRVCDG